MPDPRESIKDRHKHILLVGKELSIGFLFTTSNSFLYYRNGCALKNGIWGVLRNIRTMAKVAVGNAADFVNWNSSQWTQPLQDGRGKDIHFHRECMKNHKLTKNIYLELLYWVLKFLSSKAEPREKYDQKVPETLLNSE